MKEKIEPKHKTLRLPVFASRINCSVAKARKMIRSREIDFIRVGRLILVPEIEAERLLNEGYNPRLTVKS